MHGYDVDNFAVYDDEIEIQLLANKADISYDCFRQTRLSLVSIYLIFWTVYHKYVSKIMMLQLNNPHDTRDYRGILHVNNR